MGGVTHCSNATQRIDALVSETEWLVADDRWTEEEFVRLWRAGLEASGGRCGDLDILLSHADPAWLDRLLLNSVTLAGRHPSGEEPCEAPAQRTR